MTVSYEIHSISNDGAIIGACRKEEEERGKPKDNKTKMSIALDFRRFH